VSVDESPACREIGSQLCEAHFAHIASRARRCFGDTMPFTLVMAGASDDKRVAVTNLRRLTSHKLVSHSGEPTFLAPTS
jgi:hypothetical protein